MVMVHNEMQKRMFNLYKTILHTNTHNQYESCAHLLNDDDPDFNFNCVLHWRSLLS